MCNPYIYFLFLTKGEYLDLYTREVRRSLYTESRWPGFSCSCQITCEWPHYVWLSVGFIFIYFILNCINVHLNVSMDICALEILILIIIISSSSSSSSSKLIADFSHILFHFFIGSTCIGWGRQTSWYGFWEKVTKIDKLELSCRKLTVPCLQMTIHDNMSSFSVSFNFRVGNSVGVGVGSWCW